MANMRVLIVALVVVSAAAMHDMADLEEDPNENNSQNQFAQKIKNEIKQEVGEATAMEKLEDKGIKDARAIEEDDKKLQNGHGEVETKKVVDDKAQSLAQDPEKQEAKFTNPFELGETQEDEDKQAKFMRLQDAHEKMHSDSSHSKQTREMMNEMLGEERSDDDKQVDDDDKRVNDSAEKQIRQLLADPLSKDADAMARSKMIELSAKDMDREMKQTETELHDFQNKKQELGESEEEEGMPRSVMNKFAGETEQVLKKEDADLEHAIADKSDQTDETKVFENLGTLGTDDLKTSDSHKFEKKIMDEAVHLEQTEGDAKQFMSDEASKLKQFSTAKKSSVPMVHDEELGESNENGPEMMAPDFDTPLKEQLRMNEEELGESNENGPDMMAPDFDTPLKEQLRMNEEELGESNEDGPEMMAPDFDTPLKEQLRMNEEELGESNTVDEAAEEADEYDRATTEAMLTQSTPVLRPYKPYEAPEGLTEQDEERMEDDEENDA